MSDSLHPAITSEEISSGEPQGFRFGRLVSTVVLLIIVGAVGLAGYLYRGAQDQDAIDAAAASQAKAAEAIESANNIAANSIYTADRYAAQPPDPDFYSEYRQKHTYVGEVGTADLRPDGTYYMPSTVFLSHTGNDEWFLRDMSAPLLSAAADAGPYPLTIRIVTEPPAHMFGGGSGLEITLPTRPDFVLVSNGIDDPWWEKTLHRAEDVRAPRYYHEPMIAVTSVLPAPGLTLEDYYADDMTPSSLPIGETGYVYLSEVKQIEGTSRGYVRDWTYVGSAGDLGSHSVAFPLTHTSSGYTLCPEDPNSGSHEVYTVPGSYTPLQSEIPVDFDCGDS